MYLRVADVQRVAVLAPAIAEVARRVGAGEVGLIGVGDSVGLDLHVDRVGVSYGEGRSTGAAASPVQLTCEARGDHAVPIHPLPSVVDRVVVGPDPLEVTDPDELRRLREWVRAEQPERASAFEAAWGVAASDPADLVRGDVVEQLPTAVARVAPDALAVVTTTWALSSLGHARRLRFLERLEEIASARTLAWVSVEGVGVAPGVPTLGDRPASGHSIVGLSVLHDGARQVEAVARCWARGRWLAWLDDAG